MPVGTLPAHLSNRALARKLLVVCVSGALAACGSGSEDMAALSEATLDAPATQESQAAGAASPEAGAEEALPAIEETMAKLAQLEEQTPVVPDTLITDLEVPGEELSEAEGAQQGDLAEKATPVRQYATGFGYPVKLPANNLYRNTDQYLQGGDISPFTTPLNLWSTPSIYRAWVLAIVGSSTPLRANQYSEAKIKTVVNRKGSSSAVLSLNQKAKSPSTGVQQIALQNAWMKSEPVMYQRMWVKFDPNTLNRAKSYGSTHFWQMFWEMKADPDYRIRLQLQYSGTSGLYWQVQGDRLYNATPLWSRTLKTVPVRLASQSSSAGWHKVEIYMNRPAGRFKAAIDGKVLVDYTGKLTGSSGNRTTQLKLAMVYGQATLGEILVDDLEIFSAPPSNAWQM